MVLQLLHRGAPLSRYLSNAHHVHGMCGCCALTQLRSPRRWSRRAKTHGLLVRRHGIFNRLRCAPDQRPTRERAANHGSGHGHSVARRGRACSCSPLTAAQCSFRCSSAPVARPPSPPPLRPRDGGRHRGRFRRFSRRFRAPLAASAAAVGHCEAVWSCKAAVVAAVAAQQCGGSHQTAQGRIFGGSGDAASAPLPPSRRCRGCCRC